MSGARRPLRITEDGSIIVVRGNAKLLLTEGGFRAPYLGSQRGWALDRGRIEDLCAFLDSRRVAYVVTEREGLLHHERGGLLHRGAAERGDEHLDRPSDEHLDLFGGEVA